MVGRNEGRCALSFNLRYCTSSFPKDYILSSLLWSLMVEYLMQLFCVGFGSVKFMLPISTEHIGLEKEGSSAGLRDSSGDTRSVKQLFDLRNLLLLSLSAKSFIYRYTKFILLVMRGMANFDAYIDCCGDLLSFLRGDQLGD